MSWEKYQENPDTNENTSYLSGQIILQQDSSNTYYMRPYSTDNKTSHKIPDKDKAITIFPSWLNYFSDRVFMDDVRISVNFTIITPESFALSIPPAKKQAWVKL